MDITSLPLILIVVYLIMAPPRFWYTVALASLLVISIAKARRTRLGIITSLLLRLGKCKRKVQGVPQSQNAALPRPQGEEETNKSKQAQIEQTYEKH